MIKIDFKHLKKPLLFLMILIILSLTIPYLLPAAFTGAYLFWIVLSLVVMVYGMMLIGGLK